jgi:hypothetical protein
LYAATYAYGAYLVMGFQGTMIASPDGIAWSGRASGSTNSLRSAFDLNGTLVVAGFRGTILTSTDGLTWTNRNSGTPNSLRAIAYGKSALVVVGHYGTILKSGPIPAPVRMLNPNWMPNHFSFSFMSLNGLAYSIEYKNALNDTNWTPLGSATGNGSLLIINDPTATARSRFYRVRNE